MSKDTQAGKWYGPWAAYLHALMEERRLNPSDFAVLVGDQQNNIWNYLHGVIRPPIKKLDMWARRMQLDENEHKKFIHLGKLGHTDPEIVKEIEDLKRSRDALRATFRSYLVALGHDPAKYGL